MLSGIGGAVLFTPIFILIFPLLGPDYVLESTVDAIGTALLTQTFCFMSGFISYYRKGTIDFGPALRFLRVSVPVVILGAITAHLVHEGLLITAYAVLVFVLTFTLIFVKKKRAISAVSSSVITAIGAFMTGMVSVGIIEVIISQLTRHGVPVGIAAATSVAVVIVTVAFASMTLFLQLIRDGGLTAVPWNLVCYTIPGVLIGGQIRPRLQRLVSQHSMEQRCDRLRKYCCPQRYYREHYLSRHRRRQSCCLE